MTGVYKEMKAVHVQNDNNNAKDNANAKKTTETYLSIKDPIQEEPRADWWVNWMRIE